MQFKTLYEDQNLIVLSKPAGLLSQGDSSGEESLVDILRKQFGRHYVGLVHRLDRNTSGLMVVAKRSKAAERLTHQLQTGKLIRHYHALALGTINGPFHWEHWLLKNERTNVVSVFSEKKSQESKLAILDGNGFLSFAVSNPSLPNEKVQVSALKYVLQTGRSHQIRAQSAAMQHPIIGDLKYGDSVNIRNAYKVKASELFHRTALHSCFLQFEHPISKECLKFLEEWPEDIRSAFSAQLAGQK